MRSLIFIVILAVPVYCLSADRPADVVVFITGNTLGELKPCGCSGGQLGGFDRRPAIFDSAAPSQRMIIDTGGLVKNTDQQDLIKFDISIQALSMLGYDLVNLNSTDWFIAQNKGIQLDSPLGFISSYSLDGEIPDRISREFTVNDSAIVINIATFDPIDNDIEVLYDFFDSQEQPAAVNILILNSSDTGVLDQISGMDIADCIIGQPQFDEPVLLSRSDKKHIVLSPGRFGRYVCRVDIYTADTDGKPNLEFSYKAVSEELTQDNSQKELYTIYQQLVTKAELIEAYPRFNLPKGLSYIGSKTCKLCHEYEYDMWAKSSHASAYATLEKIGSQYDPECVVCHVVGMDYNTGFFTEQKTPNFVDVGCENCHGPGSDHLWSIGTRRTTYPQSECLDCHTQEHSSEYAEKADIYMEKIIHWREPDVIGDVK